MSRMPLPLQSMPAVFSCREDQAQDEDIAACNNAYEQHASLTHELSKLTVPEYPYGLGLKVGGSSCMWSKEPRPLEIEYKRASLGPALYLCRIVHSLCCEGAVQHCTFAATALLLHAGSAVLLAVTEPSWCTAHPVNEPLHLQGESVEYYRPDNSLLPYVLTAKRGIPISLAIIHAAVAQRAVDAFCLGSHS